MSIDQIIAQGVAKAVKELYGVDTPADKIVPQTTRKEFEGNLTVVVFPCVKAARKSPEMVGDEIGQYLTQNVADVVAKYNVVKGFLNLVISDAPWIALLNQINAYQPWPGAVYEWQGKRLKIIEAHFHPTFECDPRGRFVVNGLPAICTGDGLLVLDTVQPEGKKHMDGKAFLNGQNGWLGS